MKQKLGIIRYLTPAAIVFAALAFGATQAPADAECRSCTQPPPTECWDNPQRHTFCHNLCVEYQCDTGLCNKWLDECVCAIK